ncbi:MAG TPA: hypothetical protein VMS98_12800 [Thermoanaerobaculia bacterium]|nr:hypothetical protein [Thermoanaerobaculia bacterium]
MRHLLAVLLCVAGGASAVLAQPLIPLNDLGAGHYLGFAGGLFENGSNVPPADHAAAGASVASLVQPLDPGGNPSPSGKIVMLSIGMSNTTQEFCSRESLGPCDSWSFVGQASADPAVNHSTLLIVNGAAGGQAADAWDAPTEKNYDRIRTQNLVRAGATEAQIQVAWVKVANRAPTVSLPSEAADAYRLVAQLGDIVRALKVRYPNLRLVYLSSRIYAGYATSNLNPEPYAYESGFAVKWLVEAQTRQMRSGGVDPRAGDLNYNSGVAPFVTWGPYLWANGESPRSDGLIWLRSDLASDGTHPSTSGRTKVASLLLDFFKTEPTSKGWFLAGSSDKPGRRRAVGRPE